MAWKKPKYLITPHALARFQERINPAANPSYVRRFVRESVVVDGVDATRCWGVRKSRGPRTVCLLHAMRQIVFICRWMANGRLAVKTCYPVPPSTAAPQHDPIPNP
jgi:hypothetical protein